MLFPFLLKLTQVIFIHMILTIYWAVFLAMTLHGRLSLFWMSNCSTMTFNNFCHVLTATINYFQSIFVENFEQVEEYSCNIGLYAFII